MFTTAFNLTLRFFFTFNEFFMHKKDIIQKLNPIYLN
jgi:hypothetical protein